MSVLSARNVTRTYRTALLTGAKRVRHALNDVSLDLQAGETLALLGRSGCGKSTLARLLTGLERPDGGEVLFQGRNITTLDRPKTRAMRRAVQMVFQDSPSATDPRFTIGRIIAEPLRHLTSLNKRQRTERVTELLEQVHLPLEMATMRPAQLSGGQLQRVCIARALAPQPKVIILDESVSNLDLHLQAAALDLLRELQAREGLSYLFVTHDLRLVERFANRVAVMDDGRIVEEAPSARLHDLTHPASRLLVKAVLPPMPGKEILPDLQLAIPAQ